MMAPSSEARRLHSGLVAAFTAFVPAMDGSSVEDKGGYLALTFPAVPLPQANGVWAEDDGGATVADLADRVAVLEGRGLPFWLQTRRGRHPLVEAEAERIGLRMVEQVPGMVVTPAELSDLPETGIQIDAVSDEQRLARAHSVAEAGFEIPEGMFAPFYMPALLTIAEICFYLGSVGGEAVSTAIGYRAPNSLGIFNVATPPGYRRRGFGAALTARAAQDGIDRGATLAWLQASTSGEPVYRRMGFRTVETYNLFTRP